MPYILKLKRLWLVLLIPLSFLLTTLAGRFPAATESIYSGGFYKAVSQGFARVTGLVPFSIAEFLLIAAFASAVSYIAASVYKIILNAPDKRFREALKLLATLLSVFSVIVCGFTVLCGFNYHRLTFAELSGLDARLSSAEELADLCEELVERVNASSEKVMRDKYGLMAHSFKSYNDMAKAAADSFGAANDKYPLLGEGYNPRPKPVFFSRAMSLADLVGVYFPFTFEANVNVDVPDYEIPSSMLHELAHYKGFMREDEANFIAYVLCRENKNADFVYSGDMLALIHATNALYKADPDIYWPVFEKLSKKALADINSSGLYWKQFEGPVSKASEIVNDVYLKTNRQAEGVKSYGRMVDLLLADYRKRHDIS